MDVRLPGQLLQLAADLARAAGITADRELAGLVRLHMLCADDGRSKVTAMHVVEAWALAPDELERFIAAHRARAVLLPAELFEGVQGWAVPSCVVYEKLRAGARAGGKAAKGNLTPFRKQAPASTSSSKAGPVAPSTPAQAKAARALSAQEQCWDWLEHLRIEHCKKLGLPAGEGRQRPKLCNAKLNEACEAAGVVDQIIEQRVFTRWEYLAVLFEQHYLPGELGRARDGVLRTPPWPIELFLSPNVLRQLREQEEAAA